MHRLKHQRSRGSSGRIAGMVLYALLVVSPLSKSHRADAAPGEAALPPKERAGRLLVEAGNAIRAGQPDAARRYTEKAYQLWPERQILGHLAAAYTALGLRVEAADLARRYLQVRTEQDGPDLLRECTQAMTELTEEVGELGVRGDDGALVWVDGRLVGSLPLPLPLLVRPGEHEVWMELGPRASTHVQVQARRSEDRRRRTFTEVKLVLGPADAELSIEATGVPGAQVVVDGQPRGGLPYRGAVESGARRLEILRHNQLLYRRELVVGAGRVSLRLHTRHRARPRWRIGAAVATGVLGAISIGFGASALSVRGQAVPNPTAPGCLPAPDAPQSCLRYSVDGALGVGLGLIGVGALAVGSGVAWMLWPGPLQLVD